MDDDGVRSWLEQRVSDHEFSGVAMVWRDWDRECGTSAACWTVTDGDVAAVRTDDRPAEAGELREGPTDH